MIRYICDLCKRQIVDMDGRPVVIAFRSREVHLDGKVYYMHFHLFCAQKFLPLADIRKREEEIRNRNNGKRLQNYMNRLRAGGGPEGLRRSSGRTGAGRGCGGSSRKVRSSPGPERKGRGLFCRKSSGRAQSTDCRFCRTRRKSA